MISNSFLPVWSMAINFPSSVSTIPILFSLMMGVWHRAYFPKGTIGRPVAFSYPTNCRPFFLISLRYNIGRGISNVLRTACMLPREKFTSQMKSTVFRLSAIAVFSLFLAASEASMIPLL